MRSHRRVVVPRRTYFFPSFAALFADLFLVASLFAVLLPRGAFARGRTEVFRFERERLAFGKMATYDVVYYRGSDLTLDVGTPQLPVQIAHIALPSGMEILDVRVVRTESDTLEGRYEILPVQPPQPLSRPAVSFVGGDEAVYASADPFPREIVRSSGSGFAAGFGLGALVVYPLQYVPSENRLVFHATIEVEIAYAPSVRRPSVVASSGYAERIHRSALGSLVERPDELARATAEPRRSASLLPPRNHPYVIVTSSALAGAFDSLARWKTSKGLSALVVTTEAIGFVYPGVDLAEKIRNFIRDACESWGTVWVLLGGDTNVVPARKTYAMASGYGGTNDEIPCDLYYADLDGNWNANGNAIYGEVADSVDMYPDVFVGRASVENETEARDWARKVEIYENWASRPPGPGHELDMLFLAEILWTNPYTDSGEGKDYIDEAFVPERFDPIEKLYESRYNETWWTVMAALNAGPNIVNHNGHAWLNTLGIGSGYLYLTDMDGLTNEYRPSILYSIGCWPGAIDFDCIAEHFLANPTGGGVAFVGNSRYGWGSPGNPRFGYSDRFDQRFFEKLFVADVHRIGETLAAAKSWYVPFARQENVYRWCEYEINLLGDPEMPVWTDTAAEMDVFLPEWVPVGSSRLAITVARTSDDAPVAGALVCASKEGEVYATGLTGSDGRIELEIAPATPEQGLAVTVTAHNMKAFRTVVPVMSAGAWVQLASYTTDGSRQGYASPGATVSVDACFKNYGSETATGLSAVLHGSGSKVAMTDSTESLGTLAPGDSVFVPGAFAFATAPTLEDGAVVQLVCEVSADGPKTSARKISVTCASPLVRCDYHEIAGGDGDGFAEPGERASVVLRLVNAGLATAREVTAILDTKSPYLSVPAGPLDFGDLAPAERRTAHVEVTIDPACPAPSFPVVRVAIATGSGPLFADSLVVPVGTVGLRDDVENGEGGWTHAGTPDLWHISSHRARSGASSWYCGDEGTHRYASSVRDTLLAPPVTIGENTELSFWCWYECATYGVDGVYVEVNGGTGWKTLDFLGSGGALGTLGVGNDWLEYRYDLAAYPVGTVLQLRFRFVSDADEGLGEGVYIDDVTVGPKRPSIVVGIEPPPSPEPGDVLYPNRPNPFNPTTTIRFRLSSARRARLEIYDVRGKLVRVLMDRVVPAGSVEVEWDGGDEGGKPLASGVYFCRLTAGSFAQTRKVIVLR